MELFYKDYLKYILDKYLRESKYENIKYFILNTGVKLGVNGCKFLPGYTKIPLTEKPHHKNPTIRVWEEELFVLHDLLHQLFPLDLNSSEEEYSDSQVMGELFVFMLTEYIIQKDLLADVEISKDYKNFILTTRGYYKVIKNLIKTYGNEINVLKVLFLESKNDFIEDRLVSDIVEMFKIDYVNSRSNYKLLTKANKNLSFCKNLKTIDEHHDRYRRIFNGSIKPYSNSGKIKLNEKWI
jgi:hypothetical protein